MEPAQQPPQYPELDAALKATFFFPAFLDTLTAMTGLDVLATIARQTGRRLLDDQDLSNAIKLSRCGRRDALAIALLRCGEEPHVALDACRPKDREHDGSAPKIAAECLVRRMLATYYAGDHLPDPAEWGRNIRYQEHLLRLVSAYVQELSHAVSRELGNEKGRRTTRTDGSPLGFIYLASDATTSALSATGESTWDRERWAAAIGNPEGMLAVIGALGSLGEEARGFALLAAMRYNSAATFDEKGFREMLHAVAANYEEHE